MNGEPLPVDAWARTRQTDLHIFTQETHHARRLDPGSYALRDVETWDRMFSNWLTAKGRVRGEKVRFLWAEPEFEKALPEGAEVGPTIDGGVVVRLPFGAPQSPTDPNAEAVGELNTTSPSVDAVEEESKPIRTPKAKAAR